MRDINSFYLDWVNTSSEQDVEIKFLNIINECLLEQLILEPIREEAILGLILSNTLDLVQEAALGKPLTVTITS